MAVTSDDAERIAGNVLSIYDEILGISIIDKKGNILAANSKESFNEAFGVAEDREKYGATLAIGILTLVNELKDLFGEAQSIITVHENCKLMLLPVPSFQLLVGLVFQRAVNAEDHKIVSEIEVLVADALNHSSSSSSNL
jgi:hypothetical protein